MSAILSYLFQLGVLGAVMGDHWVVWSTVIGDEESPTSPVTVVLVAAMEKVGVKEESVTCLCLWGKHWCQSYYLWPNHSTCLHQISPFLFVQLSPCPLRSVLQSLCVQSYHIAGNLWEPEIKNNCYQDFFNSCSWDFQQYLIPPWDIHSRCHTCQWQWTQCPCQGKGSRSCTSNWRMDRVKVFREKTPLLTRSPDATQKILQCVPPSSWVWCGSGRPLRQVAAPLYQPLSHTSQPSLWCRCRGDSTSTCGCSAHVRLGRSMHASQFHRLFGALHSSEISPP